MKTRNKEPEKEEQKSTIGTPASSGEGNIMIMGNSCSSSESSDGIITIDSNRGKLFGFTTEKFNKASYLWKKGDQIWISFIASKETNKGFFKELLQNIWRQGYKVVVPTPLGLMMDIVKKYGFKQDFIKITEPVDDVCEVWIK